MAGGKRGPKKKAAHKLRSVRKELRFTVEEWKQINSIAYRRGEESTKVLRDAAFKQLGIESNVPQ